MQFSFVEIFDRFVAYSVGVEKLNHIWVMSGRNEGKFREREVTENDAIETKWE